MNIGIIGFGYWGTNLVRNFANLKNVNLKSVADERAERKSALKSLCPSAGFTTSADDILSDKEIDAVVIATPVFTHYEMAKKALNNDKHVLLEKPMVSKTDQAKELIDCLLYTSPSPRD